MNAVLLAAAIAGIFSTCYAQDVRPTPRTQPRTCPEVRMLFPFIMCDGDEFEEVQCLPTFINGSMDRDPMCYCVDPTTGDRISRNTDSRDQIDCDSDDTDDDDDMICPDLADTIERCGGIRCVRRPNDNETCLQCVESCTDDDDEEPSCRRHSDCVDGERCVITDLGNSSCMSVRTIQENGTCIPDDDGDYDDDDVDDDDDDDDDYDDDEESLLERSIGDFDRRSEVNERECSGDLVCRRNSVDTAICQMRTGPCYQNNRRPVGSNDTAPQLECDDDSGNFEAEQESDTHHWCVFPMNGTEIANTRRPRSMRLDCDRVVFQSCRIMINGRRYTVPHDDEAINFNMARGMCGFCRCNNGSFAFCRQVDCPYLRDDVDNRSCNVNGSMYDHREIFRDDCNLCRCLNGTVRCTRRDCSDDEEDDDDDADMDNRFAECRMMPYSPVCTTNLRTYPSKCAAIAAGFERFEIVPGACSRRRICEVFPCMSGLRCVARSTSCVTRNCIAAARVCINTTELMCPAELDTDINERVCGMNNRTYPSLCHMVQQSSTQIRFRRNCSRTDCPDTPVCGTDGVTYRSICDLRLQPDVRFDYRGACMAPEGNESVRNFCARVRSRTRCAARPNCNTTSRPTDGCCPVCGGGVTIGIDEEALERFSEDFDDADTTSEIRQKFTDSSIVRDISDKCEVEAQFASNGNLELFYEAKEDEDASSCAAKARMTADSINNFGQANANRRRRQSEEEDIDPIFNLVTIAATMEVTTINTTSPSSDPSSDPSTEATTNPPSGGGASVIITSYSLLLASMLLALLML